MIAFLKSIYTYLMTPIYLIFVDMQTGFLINAGWGLHALAAAISVWTEMPHELVAATWCSNWTVFDFSHYSKCWFSATRLSFGSNQKKSTFATYVVKMNHQVGTIFNRVLGKEAPPNAKATPRSARPLKNNWFWSFVFFQVSFNVAALKTYHCPRHVEFNNLFLQRRLMVRG